MKEFDKLHQGLSATYFITTQKMLEKVAITKAKMLLQMKCYIEQDSYLNCNKRGYLMDN